MYVALVSRQLSQFDLFAMLLQVTFKNYKVRCQCARHWHSIHSALLLNQSATAEVEIRVITEHYHMIS